MNIMDLTYEEISSLYAEKTAAFELAKSELDEANAMFKEWRRLNKIKESLGNVSADDIAKIVEAITLSANSINTQESVQL